jgi:hypothetical protein
MKEKDFEILSRDKESENLLSRLSNWKIKADGFYRASEIIFNQINNDIEKLLGKAKKRIESNVESVI